MFSVLYMEHKLTDYLIVTDLDRGILPEREDKTIKVPSRDGLLYVNKRNGIKKITMDFVLRNDLIAKRRSLANILNQKEPQKLIFSDEPDRYWLAVPSGDINVSENRFIGRGTITWICYTPYAISLTPQKISGTKTIRITNNGTAPAPLKVTIKSKSDNGFVGLSLTTDKKEDTQLFQVGVPGQTDYTPDTKEEWLINDIFKSASPEGWEINPPSSDALVAANQPNGKPWVVGGSFIYYDRKEATNMERFSGTINLDTVPDMQPGQWGGPVLAKEIPASSDGSLVFPNLQVGYHFKWMASSGVDLGCAQYLVTDENGDVVFGVVLVKDSFFYLSRARFIVHKTVVEDIIFTPSVDETNPIGSWYNTELIMNRFDNVYKIRLGGKIYTFTAENDMNPKYMVIALGTVYGGQKVVENFAQTATLRKPNVPYEKDIPNFLSDGDIMVIDANDNSAKLNGYSVLNYVDIASQPLMVPPGESVLTLTTSDFAVEPDIEGEFYERWV